MTINELVNSFITGLKTKEKKDREETAKKVAERQIKYPYQVASAKRAKKVLGIDAKLSAVPEDTSDSPLEMHSGFSRYELTIVDKEAKTTPTANIPAEDIPYIMETTRVALATLLSKSAQSQKSDNSTSNLAYTQKLIDKRFRGLTPAAVLLADPSQKDELTRVKEWLAQNVAKYPSNKLQMDAITEAIKLLETNNLKDVEATATSDIEIYKTDYKFKSKKNEKGNNLIYSIEITCDPTKNYPFTVSIMNCYAPVETSPSGQKNIKMTAAENTVKNSIALDKMEWVRLISRLSKTLDLFEQENFPKLFEQSQIAALLAYKAATKDTQNKS